MKTTMKRLIEDAGFNGIDESAENDEKHSSETRRMNDVVKRPDTEVELKSLSMETKVAVKTQKDPTDDLIFLPRTWKGILPALPSCIGAGFIIKDKDTGECWYAPNKLCLDRNFIYRDDLEIVETIMREATLNQYMLLMQDVDHGKIPCTTKYILDDPGAETYEVYADSNYPSQKYGKATPTGMFVHKYSNRFHRDMAIIELDALYTNSSNKAAAKLTAGKFSKDEAIIVSDGAWMQDTSSYAYVYLDDVSVIKYVEGTLPSEPDQAVLISEVNGAYSALMQCYNKKKKKITYYYDNTSILNVFKNRKTEYITEIKAYKDLCEKMLKEGYQVTFVELHPKTDEEKDKLNRACTYFHNTCDDECRKMAALYKRDYKSYVHVDESTGQTFAQFMSENKPKGRPGGNNGKPKGKANFTRR